MFKHALFIVFLTFISLSPLMALKEKPSNYFIDGGYVIGGYDPVSYFTEGKAKKGDKSYAVTENGVTFLFSSQKNKDLFTANPGKYEPEYGGWCAYAIGAEAEKVEIDPKTFKIRNGKLYLFYNFFFNNTLKTWNKDEENLNAKADQNWKKFQ